MPDWASLLSSLRAHDVKVEASCTPQLVIGGDISSVWRIDAMTELFGGFGEKFYVACDRTWPLSPGFGERRLVYQLYHVLNHLNIFGVDYLHSAHRIIKQLI